MVTEAEMEPFPRLRNGVLVEVRSGPSKGLRGLVADRMQGGRIILQVDALGKPVRMEFDATILDVVE